MWTLPITIIYGLIWVAFDITNDYVFRDGPIYWFFNWQCCQWESIAALLTLTTIFILCHACFKFLTFARDKIRKHFCVNNVENELFELEVV